VAKLGGWYYKRLERKLRQPAVLFWLSLHRQKKNILQKIKSVLVTFARQK